MTSDATEMVPEWSGSKPSDQARSGRSRAALVGTGITFGLLTIAMTAAMYQFGDGHVFIGERTISDMNPFEVTGGAAVGVAGLALGLGAAALALVIALIATVLSLALAALGVGFGLFVTVGVVTGPILLAVILAVMIKRRYWPDVI